MRPAARQPLDRLSNEDRGTLRRRHIHGDDQIRSLYAMTRSFAASHQHGVHREQLERITAWTLIVRGDRDPYYPVEIAVEPFQEIPHSALWVVPYGGHGPVFGPLAPAFVHQAITHLQASDS
jgi:pimeloyl-ACP methyl ester carboxylesterase